MGACTFQAVAKGANVREAFAAAREDALYEYGHRGYTGTIAEKRDWVVIPKPAGIGASEYAHKLIEDGDPRIDDKWGPAGAIDLGNGNFLFFGWASE